MSNSCDLDSTYNQHVIGWMFVSVIIPLTFERTALISLTADMPYCGNVCAGMHRDSGGNLKCIPCQPNVEYDYWNSMILKPMFLLRCASVRAHNKL